MPCNRIVCWCCGNVLIGEVGFEFETNSSYAYGYCQYCDDVKNHKQTHPNSGTEESEDSGLETEKLHASMSEVSPTRGVDCAGTGRRNNRPNPETP